MQVAEQLNCARAEHPDLSCAVITHAYRHEYATTELANLRLTL